MLDNLDHHKIHFMEDKHKAQKVDLEEEVVYMQEVTGIIPLEEEVDILVDVVVHLILHKVIIIMEPDQVDHHLLIHKLQIYN